MRRLGRSQREACRVLACALGVLGLATGGCGEDGADRTTTDAGDGLAKLADSSPADPREGRDEAEVPSAVGAVGDHFIAVAGLPENTTTVYARDGSVVSTLPLPFQDPLYRPHVSMGSEDRVVVAGIPCSDRIAEDSAVECLPGGISAAVLDVEALDWIVVYDRIIEQPYTQSIAAGGIMGDEAIVVVELSAFALPIDGGEAKDLGPVPLHAQALCVSDSGAIAARSDAPEVAGGLPTWPLGASLLAAEDARWSSEVVQPNLDAGAMTGPFLLGCTDGAAFAVPVVSQRAEPPSTYLLPFGSATWSEEEPPPAFPVDETSGLPALEPVVASRSLDGAISLFFSDPAQTVLTLVEGGRWEQQSRTDGLHHPVANVARAADRYLSLIHI